MQAELKEFNHDEGFERVKSIAHELELSYLQNKLKQILPTVAFHVNVTKNRVVLHARLRSGRRIIISPLTSRETLSTPAVILPEFKNKNTKCTAPHFNLEITIQEVNNIESKTNYLPRPSSRHISRRILISSDCRSVISYIFEMIEIRESKDRKAVWNSKEAA